MLRHSGVRTRCCRPAAAACVALGGRGDGWRVDVVSPLLPGRTIAAPLAAQRAARHERRRRAVRRRRRASLRSRHRSADRLAGGRHPSAQASSLRTPRRADALSTAFLVGGIDLAERYCAEHRDVLALITPDDGSERPIVVRQSSWSAARQAIDREQVTHHAHRAFVEPRNRPSLVVLRTLVGWHFLYEGYTKLLHPAWSQTGAPLPPWSSAGYLKAATGPLAPLFHWMGNASWIGSLDLLIAVGLTAVGAQLDARTVHADRMRRRAWRCWRRSISRRFPPAALDARAEGTYLLVNKNLIEAGAVLVLFAFRTGIDRRDRSIVESSTAGQACRCRRQWYESDTRTDGSGAPQLPEGARGHSGTGGARRSGGDSAVRCRGGRVRLGFIGVGSQGRAQLDQRRSCITARCARSATSTRRS